MITTLALFLAGLLLMIVGAESLVKGSSRLAAGIGISPLVIGLTVVALGTSSPELAVSIKAALAGKADLALGNVIGSNIFNVLFILGVSALIVPLAVSRQLVRLDVPLMIAVSFLVLLFALDGNLGWIDGAVLLMGLAVYISVLVYLGRKEGLAGKDARDEASGAETSTGTLLRNTALILGGLALLVLGSRWLVDGAVALAQYMGVSELIIGLTIVAVGTSLPEVVTSIIAAIRGERDIAVGNVVGSNIFNLMAVLGVASIVAPAGIEVAPAVIRFDIPVMIAVAFACLPIFFTGGEISRQEGAVLLGYYIAYTLYIFLAASQHDSLTSFSSVMLYFVLPLTVLTLVIIALRELGNRRKQPSE
ncbi:MAG: cation:H+ antiporter [Gammaproteobacteria bacterium]|jgi:cation:H+ antiporter